MWRYRRILLLALVLVVVLARSDWWADDPGREADRLLGLGRKAVAAEDWDKADEYADRLIASEHRDHGRLLRGEALFKQHKPESAFEILNKVRGEQLRVDAARTQGHCLLEMGNQREADLIFQHVIQQRPDDVDVFRALAVIAYDQGNWLHAEAYLKKVAELAPTDGRPYFTLGLMYHDLTVHPQAEAYYRESLSRDLPGDLPILVRAALASSLYEQKRFAEALEEFDRAKMPFLTWQQARVRIDCLRSVGRVEEALIQVDVYLAQNPTEPGLVGEKGLSLLDLKRPADAVVWLERALSASPHDRRARHGLRQAYQALGRSDDALEQQRKLAESDELYQALSDLTQEAMAKPWDPAVRYKMAETCEKLQKPELAEMWRKAARACEGR